MTAPLDFSAMGRVVESTLSALDQARGAGAGGGDDQPPLSGHGEGADGLIRVDAVAGGRLANLEFDPRAMRMDSVTLSEAILTAANAALADLQAKLRAGIAGPDLDSLADQLKEVQAESSRQMGTFIQALVDAQERIANSARSR